MKIASSLLRDIVSHRKHLGHSGLGTIYDAPENLSCNWQPTVKTISNDRGEVEVATAEMMTGPDELLQVNDAVIKDSRTYQIIWVDTIKMYQRPHHIEALLQSIPSIPA